MGIQKKEPESIKSLLSDIRNKGIKNPQYIRKLLVRLTEKNDWSDEECRRFYEALLRKYIKNEHYLNLMFAVSGVDERFGGCLISASKRRENYFEYLRANDPTEERVDVDSLRKNEEEQCLSYIAEKLEEVIKNGENSRLFEQLIFGEEMKNAEENTKSAKNTEEGDDSQKQQSASLPKRNKNIFKNIGSIFGDVIINSGEGSQVIEKTTSRKNNFIVKIRNITRSVIIVGVVGIIIKVSIDIFENNTHSSVGAYLTARHSEGKFEISFGFISEEAVDESLNNMNEDSGIQTIDFGESDSSSPAYMVIGSASETIEKLMSIGNSVVGNKDVNYSEPRYTVQASVRFAGTTGKNWTDNLEVEIGDELEYQIVYKNTDNINQYNVMLRDVLPNNVEYIPSSTKFWNGTYDGATATTDNLVNEKGINIGNYAPGANAIVRFRVKVVDKNLADGSNTVVNWAQGSVGNTALQDYANVHLTKNSR